MIKNIAKKREEVLRMKKEIKKVLATASMNLVEKRGSHVLFGETQVPAVMLKELKSNNK